MSQRCLSQEDIEYVVFNGRRYHNAGAVFVYLGKRDIPRREQWNDQVSRLVGTTVLLDPQEAKEVITVYRNRASTRHIRIKAKYNRKNSIQGLL